MDYIKCSFTFKESIPWSEILMTYLTDLPFESFEEEEGLLKAYIPHKAYKKESIEAILKDFYYQELTFTDELIKDENWNAEWEKNFSPIYIDEKCVVKAPFHNLENTFPYEILINPQMSFGTGHHQTTYLILKEMFSMDLKDKTVLDMGCGTGILAILAEQLKAKSILAIDIDDWAYRNTLENIELNNCWKIETKEGGAELLNKNETFSVILANINRNILLNDMRSYVSVLKHEGEILMSGFYTTDVHLIEEEAKLNGLVKDSVKEHEGWAMAKFIKA
jgi:ribosomal protein L11 methyltransferase